MTYAAMGEGERQTGAVAPVDRPLFLVGAERSGTTLLRLMLEHHPRLAFRNEFEFVVDLVGDDGAWPSIDAYTDWLSTHRIFLNAGFSVDESLSYPDLCRDFLEQHRAGSGKDLVGATVHRHFDRLLLIWPEARFIHLVRDPRDVANSNIGMGWAGNVWHGAGRWVEAEQLWDAFHVKLAPSDWITVTYEELVADPRPVLARICAFIGIDYDDAMLSYPEDTTYERPDASLRNQWQRKLTPREVQYVEARVGALLEARGYQRSEHAPRTPSALGRLRLSAQDWYSRKANGVRKFGWKLMLLKAFARRLGLRELEKRVDLARNEITNRQLR